MLHKRTAIVNHVKTKVMTIGSNLQIGDSAYVHAYARGLAVQREQQLFFTNEGAFSHHVFKMPLPDEPAEEQITFESIHLNPMIKVDTIDITSVSSASLLHLGNSRDVVLESRIKNIRQLREERRE